MSHYKRILSILMIILGVFCVFGILNKPFIEKESENMKKGEFMMKMKRITFNYSFLSETILFNVGAKDLQTSHAKINLTFAVDILHFDGNGCILARYRLVKCISGPCHYRMPSVYVKFLQGKSNLEEIFGSKGDENYSWNPLFGIVSSIYTTEIYDHGDKQIVMTPYGICRIRFTKPADKLFRRRLDRCRLETTRNHSFIPALNTLSYNQNVSYRQNKKLDADIIEIIAHEILEVDSFIDRKWKLHLHTTSHTRMLQREEKFANRFCEVNTTADECAKKVFNAISLGKTWRKIRSNFENDIQRPSKLSFLLRKLQVLNIEEFKISQQQPVVFAELFKELLLADEDEVLRLIRKDKNEITTNILLNALGATGRLVFHKIVRKSVDRKLPELREIYLQSLMLSTKITPELIEDLENWFEKCDNDDIRRQLSFTIAVLYRRYCESEISRLNACNNGKEKKVQRFINKFTTCKTTECHTTALEVLQNVPLASLISYTKQFLCTNNTLLHALQQAALRLLSLIDKKFLDYELIDRLVRIFRNVCPLWQPTSDQNRAGEILLDALLYHTSVASYILRSESLIPNNHEKWAYFYANQRQQRTTDIELDKYWRKMRNFRVFRPNYSQRSLRALSNVLNINITNKGPYQFMVIAKSEFNAGILKYGDFLLNMLDMKGKKNEIFGLSVDLLGCDSLISSDNSGTNENRQGDNCYANLQLRILNNRLPIFKLFEGTNELISLIWNADGKPIEAFSSNLILQHLSYKFPLLSGLIASVDIIGSLSLKLIASSKMNLWNRDADLMITIDSSMILDGTIELSSSNDHIYHGDITAKYLANPASDINFKVEFNSLPYLFCTIISQKPFYIRQSYSSKIEKTKRKTIIRNWNISGYCYSINDNRLSNMCSHFLESI